MLLNLYSSFPFAEEFLLAAFFFDIFRIVHNGHCVKS